MRSEDGEVGQQDVYAANDEADVANGGGDDGDHDDDEDNEDDYDSEEEERMRLELALEFELGVKAKDVHEVKHASIRKALTDNTDR